MPDSSTPRAVDPPDRPEPLSRRRKLLFTILLIGMLLAVFLAALDLIFYRPRLARLRQRQRPATERLETRRTVDDQLIRRLGYMNPRKRSSFFNFPVAKPEGKIRVCAFGDSFTYGDEVGAAADFPSILQRRFANRGANHVEVLNFGNGWHGFHQAYMLWSALGREYGCDYALLGPACFQPLRDTRFNHTIQFSSPYYLHARYVLKGDGVELVEVLGETHEERFRHYFRRFTHLRYLRYDRNAPFFLSALVPENRVLANPFYYSEKSEDEEAFATYEILLAKMLQDGVRVVLGHYHSRIVEIGRRLRDRGLFSAQLHRFRWFPYLAPKAHNSAWGNQLVADQFLALLTGLTRDRLTWIQTLPAPAASPGKAEPQRSLASCQDIRIEMAGRPVGRFVTTDGNHHPFDFRDHQVDSLLGFQARGGSLMNGLFVPLDFAVGDGAEITLRIGGRSHRLGRVRLLGGGPSIGVSEVAGMTVREKGPLLFAGNREVPGPEVLGSRRRVALLVGETPVLEGTSQGNQVSLTPVRGSWLMLRAPEGSFIALSKLGPSGVFELAAELPGGQTHRIPIAGWKKVTGEVTLTEEPIRWPLEVPGSRPVRPGVGGR